MGGSSWAATWTFIDRSSQSLMAGMGRKLPLADATEPAISRYFIAAAPQPSLYSPV
jgi:hypothetical protein